MAVDGVLRVCLIGQGITQSLSPALHEAEAAALGLRYSCELVDLDDEPDGPEALEGALGRIQSAGFAGCNITFPAKQCRPPGGAGIRDFLGSQGRSGSHAAALQDADRMTTLQACAVMFDVIDRTVGRAIKE
jgi:hypothetical protein